jgi:alpha-glucosidase/alpha-D-xyloside xylohydrolase
MHATLTATRERVLLERGRVRVEVALHPLRLHVRRDGRRLLRGAHVWVADGEVHDRFLQLTEGVMARELLGVPERAASAAVARATADGAVLALVLHSGRRAELRIALPEDEHVVFELEAEGGPLRLALEWDERPEERFNGLGARHHPLVDHHGRAIQLGADRAYTGPDCPPDMLELGGIPQGDYAPVPWLQSSRGYAVWVQTWANGTRFDLGPPASGSRSPRAPWPGPCACTCSPGRRPPRGCGASCSSRACRPCSPSGATGSGSRATSTTTRTTSWRT